MKNLVQRLLILTLVVTALMSCKKDEEAEQKNVTVKLTDAPFPFSFVSHAHVGIAKVELKNTSGEYVTVFEGNSNHDMVGLTNGETENVTSVDITPGTYTHARVTFNAASVELTDGTEYEMNSQASHTHEINILPFFVVEEGEESELLLDLDINESFSFQGTFGPFSDWISSIANITGCNFHAHFRACDLDQTGEIHGTVSNENTGENIANAYVTVTVNGHEIATHTDSDGHFVFIGIPAGSYSVDVETSDSLEGDEDGIQVTVGANVTCSVTVD